MSIVDFAKREFLLAGYTPVDQYIEGCPEKWIQENVFELLAVFANQGHSGFSAPFVIDIFATLASYKLLTPLTGADDEWTQVSNDLWQNNRCGSVFKTSDGKAYHSDRRVFRTKNYCYTNKDSRVYIEFPYTPIAEYVDVDNLKGLTMSFLKYFWVFVSLLYVGIICYFIGRYQ